VIHAIAINPQAYAIHLVIAHLATRAAAGPPRIALRVYAWRRETSTALHLHVAYTYPNYETILDYNCAHLYALSVGILADRLE